MPACDVTLTAEVREMAPSEYAIHYENEDEFYFSDVPSTALAGSEVSFMITVTDLSIGITRVSYGLEAEEFCEPNNVDVGPDYKRYSFTFTMPDHEVSLLAAAAIEYNDITRIGDEHARVRLVNSIIKDENGDPLTDENGEYICRNYYGQLMKFVYEIELGYNYTMTIVGDRTGTHFEDKIYFLDSDFDAGQCWALEMPAEPITFTVVSSEKTDFVGKPFVGNYNGFFINTTQIGKLEKADAANLNVELKTNTVFEFKSSDVNAYNFRGMMSYDESDNQFEYLRESCDGYGLSGYWSETMTLAWVTNIIEDMPENTRFYIMSKDDLSNFVSAGNAGGTKYLLEVKTAQGTQHYLFERENYRLRTVDVDFTSGSSIGDASASGYVVEEGVKLLKYTCDRHECQDLQPHCRRQRMERSHHLLCRGRPDRLQQEAGQGLHQGNARPQRAGQLRQGQGHVRRSVLQLQLQNGGSRQRSGILHLRRQGFDADALAAAGGYVQRRSAAHRHRLLRIAGQADAHLHRHRPYLLDEQRLLLRDGNGSRRAGTGVTDTSAAGIARPEMTL